MPVSGLKTNKLFPRGKIVSNYKKDPPLKKLAIESWGNLHIDDLTTFKRDMADLTGVAYGGVSGR